MNAEIKRYDGVEATAGPGYGGITLLEAYSALTSRKSSLPSAVEIPFPGHPTGSDPGANFWTLRIRNTG